MKKKFYLSLILVAGTMMSAFPQSMVIGAGADNGILICAQGYLYAWGYNPNNKLGLEPPYNTVVDVLVPRKVKIPDGITFSQVTAGSSNHFLALSCTGVVYAWGGNFHRQCGQPTGNEVSVPTPVPRGVTSGYNEDGTSPGPYLGGVKFVCGSSNASFAILETGQAVGWGSGNWISATTVTPVYIRRTNATTGPILQDVVHIGSGDNNIFFLVDPDGKGYGDLYSMGNWNGRGLDGGGNSFTAEPVETDETTPRTPLKNIRMAIGMDVGGFAVDAITGYVYGWGEGWWGCCNGIVPAGPVVYARKVVSGHYKIITGNDYLTDVIEVVGGNGYGAAVTKEGYVLYWGNDNTLASGGVLPNGNNGATANTTAGANTCDTGPQFAVYCDPVTNATSTYPVGNATTPPNPFANPRLVTDAVRLSRGDLVGFMINEKNEFYIWGRNGTNTGGLGTPGMLGLGELLPATAARCMRKMTDLPCDPPDPCPQAHMSARQEKCKDGSVTLPSGFSIPVGVDKDGDPYGDRYYFRWYYEGNLLNTTTKDAPKEERRADVYNKTEITVNKPGTYIVEIEYISVNAPCSTCDISTETIEVVDREILVVPTVKEICIANPVSPTAGDEMCFEFTSKYANAATSPSNQALPSKFVVYQYPTEGPKITTKDGRDTIFVGTGSNNTGSFCVAGNQVEVNTQDSTYNIYLEDLTLTPADGILAKNRIHAVGGSTSTRILLEVKHSVTLREVTLYGHAGNSGPGNTKDATIRPYIIGDGNAPAAQTDIAAQQTFTLVKGNPGPRTPMIITLGDYVLQPGRYWLGFTINNLDAIYCSENPVTVNNGQIFTTPLEDDIMIGGWTLYGIRTNTPNGNNGRYIISHLKFSTLVTASNECGRIKLTSKYLCPPCITPDEQGGKRVEITTPAGTKKDGATVQLCAGDGVILSTAQLKTGAADATNQFDIIWYEGNKTNQVRSNTSVTNGTDSYTVNTWNLTSPTIAETKKYYVKVQDHIKSTEDCWVWDSIEVRMNPKPAATLTPPTPFCQGDLLTEPNKTISGSTITWYSDTPPTPANQMASAPTVIDKAGSAMPYTYYYIVKNNNSECEGDPNIYSFTVYQIPPDPIVKEVDFLVDDLLDNLPTGMSIAEGAQANGAGNTVYWYTDKASAGSTTAPYHTDATVARYDNHYWVKQISNTGSCESDFTLVIVNVLNAPRPEVRDTAQCQDETPVDLNILVKAKDANHQLLWYPDGSPDKTNGATAPPLVSTGTPGVYEYFVAQKDVSEAISEKAKITVTIHATPIAKLNNPDSFCQGSTEAEPAKTISGHEVLWYTASDGVTPTGAPTIRPLTASDVPYNYYYKVKSQAGCISDVHTYIVTVNPLPVAVITNNSQTDVLTCKTPKIELTASGGTAYVWDDGLGNNANATVENDGTYTVTVTDDNLCKSDKSITIDINKTEPAVSITNSTTELTCDIEEIELKANATGVSFSWNTDENTATIFVSTPNTYKVTVTDEINGCKKEASVTITESTNKPTLSITKNPDTDVLTCKTPTTTLTVVANVAVSYLWETGEDTSTKAVSTAGTYKVTVKDVNGCATSGSVTITENKLNPVITVNSPAICKGDEAILTANGADTYTWTPATGLNATEGKSVTANPETTTLYTVEGTVNATNCKSSATATVYVETPLILTLTAPGSVELGNEITITVSADGPAHGIYEWFINNEPYTATAENYITLKPAAGKQLYRVESRTSELNCFAASEAFNLNVNESIPNIINPYNPSGKNCCFMMSNGIRAGYQVEIYNRYMQKVFEGENGWDGTYRGVPADPGTYFYRLFKKDGEIEKGTLEVVKF